MKKIILIGCFLVLCFFMSKVKAQQLPTYKKSAYTSTLKEADAVVSLSVFNFFEDSCKNCVSDGGLYIIKAKINRLYFNKVKKLNVKQATLKDTFLFMASGGEMNLIEQKPDSIIVFLSFHNPTGKRYYEPPKTPNIFWYATELLEKTDSDFTAIEKLIIKQTKKYHAVTKL